MKDIYGNEVHVPIPPLDMTRRVNIYTDTVSTTLVDLTYTPQENGFYVIECSYRPNSRCEILSGDGSFRYASVNQGNEGSENRATMIPAYKEQTLRFKGRNFNAFFIPYI